MTTEDLKPCPFCKKKPLIRNAYGSVQPRLNHSCGFVDIHEGAIPDWNSAYCWKRIDELEKELLEQARVNGMGGERESDLLGKLWKLEKELAIEKTKNHAVALKDCRELFDDLVKESKKIVAQRDEAIHVTEWSRILKLIEE